MTSTLKTNAIEPEGGTTNLVIGESGQNTVISNNDIRANVLQDAGGNAVFTSNGSGVLSGINSGFGSAMVLLSTQTASNSASISFTSGIDSTYGEYIFKFYNINPATDNTDFSFQVNSTNDAGGGYDTSLITSGAFTSSHDEANTAVAEVSYDTGGDLAQSANFQVLCRDCGNGADESCAGIMHLFSPSSTTYVKHFYATVQYMHYSSWARTQYTAGYINDASYAIDDIQFKMSSGNFDGKIKMWGVK